MSEIGYKNLKVLRSLFTVAWHPILIALFLWLTVRYSKGKIVLTSGFREGDAGVHGTMPLRGLDIRSTVFKNPQQICDDINKEWIYDDKRPDKKVAIYHNVGKGLHIHLQIHSNTKWNGGK